MEYPYLTKTCKYSNCNNEFQTKRSKRKYCSSTCRSLAHKKRTGQLHKPLEEHICERIGCIGIIPAGSRITTRYCSNACRQKVYNDKNKDKVKEQYKESKDKERRIKAIREVEEESERIADEFIRGYYNV